VDVGGTAGVDRERVDGLGVGLVGGVQGGRAKGTGAKLEGGGDGRGTLGYPVFGHVI